FLLTKLTNAE
nr:GAP-3, GTPase-activating protein [cattle, brain, Peptide Partial, 10 aa] [Bos taurus]